MTLAAGTRLGVYEVVAQIGAGGMGEVYRAHDTRLNRDVALKVLPEAFARDTQRMARFEREAKVLASLNHPNIAAIYGLEESGPIFALVMELVEGPTLAERIAAGPVPVDEALPIARQVADAVEYAHDKNVIHRDLKPANIKVTAEGTVKVLDFGLAKALSEEVAAEDMANSPTLSMAATRQGVILGTAAYMSPEQAKGKSVDRRTDVWAFGCVLLEMLTGKQAFHGEDVSEVLAAVLRAEPAWNQLSTTTPQAVRNLLCRCLEKNIKRRLAHIGEARILLEDVLSGALPAEPVGVQRTSRERLAWTVAVVAIAAFLVALVPAILYWRGSPRAAQSIRFTIAAPEKGAFPSGNASPWPAVSPDGQQVAFAASTTSGMSLWIRGLNSLSAQTVSDNLIAGSAPMPFWSPDSRSIGFFADGKLKKVAASGGPAETLCNVAGEGGGGTWNREGTVLFSQAGGIFRVSAAGGESTGVTRVDSSRTESAHVLPRFLPDGRHFLYVVLSSKAENAGIYVGSLDSSQAVRILNVPSQVEYSAGHLLFVRGNTLEAQPFDPNHQKLTGDSFPVAEGIGNNVTNARAALGASPEGVVAYRGNFGGPNQLAWLDRTGKQLITVGESGSQPITHFSLSADEQRAAVAINSDLWVVDLTRRTTSRLTFGDLAGEGSAWSPDGSRVYFAGNAGGVQGLYQKASDGSGNEDLLFKKADAFPSDVSHDGKYLLFGVNEPETGADLWILPLSGERQPKAFLQNRYDEAEGAFSPDGRWIAYVSDETGRSEIYVQPFAAGSGSKWQVSTEGGEQPKWRADGKEIFYLSAGRLMAVEVKAGPQFQAGQPQLLFEDLNLGAHTVTAGGSHYAVSRDGKRVIIFEPISSNTEPSLTVVVNWTAGLKK